jgi:hypothetical protein
LKKGHSFDGSSCQVSNISYQFREHNGLHLSRLLPYTFVCVCLCCSYFLPEVQCMPLPWSSVFAVRGWCAARSPCAPVTAASAGPDQTREELCGYIKATGFSGWRTVRTGRSLQSLLCITTHKAFCLPVPCRSEKCQASRTFCDLVLLSRDCNLGLYSEFCKLTPRSRACLFSLMWITGSP